MFQPDIARPGYLMNIAIPLTVNLFLAGAVIRGRIGFRQIELSRALSPAKFYVAIAAAFVIVNGFTLYAILNHWFRQP